MKFTEITIFLAAAVIVCSASFPANAYQRCEKYEYAELKAMSAKQLEGEFCKSDERVNEMYQTIGTSLSGDPIGAQAIRDRDDCWDAMDKMTRQARFKQVKANCPNVKRVDPLQAAAEKAEADAEQARRKLNELIKLHGAH